MVKEYKSTMLSGQTLQEPTHPYQLEGSMFNFRGVWCTFSFLFCFKQIFLLANSEDPDQTPQNRRRILRRLIWVCTVCLCPKNGMPDVYGLKKRYTTMSCSQRHLVKAYKITIKHVQRQHHYNVMWLKITRLQCQMVKDYETTMLCGHRLLDNSVMWSKITRRQGQEVKV